MSLHHHPRSRRQAAVVIAPVAALGAVALLAGCGLGHAVHSAQSVANEIHTLASVGESSAAAASSPSTSAAAIDLCGLLTAAQASDIEHITYDTTQSTDNGEFHGCSYHNSNTTDRGDTMDLTVTTTMTSDCWDAVTSSDGPGTAVSGVGDSAFGTSLELDVQSGDRCLTVEGQSLAESNGDWSADVAVAQLLLPELGAS